MVVYWLYCLGVAGVAGMLWISSGCCDSVVTIDDH